MVLKEVLKMKSIGWALIQQDWGPYEKRRSGQTHTVGRVRENTGEGGRPQVNARGLRRNQTCGHLDLGLPASRTLSE